MDLTASINNIPLRVLIKRMLDEAFGTPNSTINVIGDQCNLENKNYEVDASYISIKDNSISSHDGTTDCSPLHESLSSDTNHKNNKLITIEEESINSSHHSDSIEYTGIYLNGLLKFKTESVSHRIKCNNNVPVSLQNDAEIFPSQVDTNISINNSSCPTNFVNNELSICQENDDDSSNSIMIINNSNSVNNIDVSSNDENTADFLNKTERSPKTKQVPCEAESGVDTSLVNHGFVKNNQMFTSTLTLKKRTPKTSKNRNKFFKTPCFNVSLTNKNAQYRSKLYVTTANTLKTPKTVETPKISKVYPKRAKSFKFHGIPKQNQMVVPQIILTPATPKLIS